MEAWVVHCYIDQFKATQASIYEAGIVFCNQIEFR